MRSRTCGRPSRLPRGHRRRRARPARTARAAGITADLRRPASSTRPARALRLGSSAKILTNVVTRPQLHRHTLQIRGGDTRRRPKHAPSWTCRPSGTTAGTATSGRPAFDPRRVRRLLTPSARQRRNRMTIRLLLADDQELVRSRSPRLARPRRRRGRRLGRGDEVAHHPDVALLDIEMPGLDGLAAAALLTTHLPSCRVIILTRAGLKSRIGIVLQSTSIDRYLTVRETIAMYATFYPHPRSVDEVIHLVGLEEKRDSRVLALRRSTAATRRGDCAGR